jgi:hypothetical protein
MRIGIIGRGSDFCLMVAAAAQTAGDGSIPRRIGNRANGCNDRPTPREVVSPEKAPGCGRRQRLSKRRTTSRRH